MAQVSCRVTGWIIGWLQTQEISARDWARGLPIGPGDLTDPHHRISWELFVALCQRVDQLCLVRRTERRLRTAG